MSFQVLTRPPEPKHPGAVDNINDDLIVTSGDVLTSSVGLRYADGYCKKGGTFPEI